MTLLAGAVADLGDLLDPEPVEDFWDQHWERSPLVLRGGRDHKYDGLFSMSDLDRLLSSGSVPISAIGLVASGQTIPLRTPPGGLPDSDALLEAAYREFSGGASMVLRSVQENQPALRALCEQLSRQFVARINANAYLTPRGAQGLLPHHDTHDVLVLQVTGSKHWRLYESPLRLPVSSQGFSHATDEVGEVTEEFTLGPGDLLYLPRGVVHDAHSEDVSSLHLTIGIFPLLWADVLRSALEAAIAGESRLRESVPFGHPVGLDDTHGLADEFQRLWALVADEVAVAALMDDALADARSDHLAPSARGRLLDLHAEDEVDVTTRLSRRPLTDWSLTRDGEHVSLVFSNKAVRFPGFVEPQLRFVTEAADVAVTDLPPGLDDASALVLLKRLLREGFLTTSVTS